MSFKNTIVELTARQRIKAQKEQSMIYTQYSQLADFSRKREIVFETQTYILRARNY